jgi:hypothetical protein
MVGFIDIQSKFSFSYGIENDKQFFTVGTYSQSSDYKFTCCCSWTVKWKSRRCKSTIVNLSRIKEYSSQEIFMCDGSVVRISRRKTDLFRTSIITVPRLTAPFDKCFSCNSEDICCKSFRAKLIGTDENIFPKSL